MSPNSNSLRENSLRDPACGLTDVHGVAMAYAVAVTPVESELPQRTLLMRARGKDWLPVLRLNAKGQLVAREDDARALVDDLGVSGPFWAVWLTNLMVGCLVLFGCLCILAPFALLTAPLASATWAVFSAAGVFFGHSVQTTFRNHVAVSLQRTIDDLEISLRAGLLERATLDAASPTPRSVDADPTHAPSPAPTN